MNGCGGWHRLVASFRGVWTRKLSLLMRITFLLTFACLLLLTVSINLEEDKFAGFGRPLTKVVGDVEMEVNNHADHDHLTLVRDRQRNETQLKTILMWNDAYGERVYDIGHGREPFYRYKCPETRCYATANRSYLPNVQDFDALLIHQRAIDWDDMPAQRSPHQRYVHWLAESAQYVYMDVSKLNNYFNWTMTYRRDSDIYLPYGRFHQIKSHPMGEELDAYIKKFGQDNRHLARNRTEFKAAWFVSHCATQARREQYARAMKRYMSVHIYGKCGRYHCDRKSGSKCYQEMESNYKFYLSFENSICNDYVTEKFFNVLKYNVIPVTFGAHNFSGIGPPHHAFISVFDYKSPKRLVAYLETLQNDDAKYAEYFWWKDFYEVRNDMADRAQSYCDLCQKLNDPKEPPKVYHDMKKWWISDSHCKKLRSSFYNQD